MTELTINGPGPKLSATRGGPSDGPVRVVMLHGLTATRHYTVMGSHHLDRRGVATLAYDARGHGHSARASGPADYGYPELAADLHAVIEQVSADEPVVLLGISMGAHTAVRYAIDRPERVAGMVLITPAHLPGPQANDRSAWSRLAQALRGPDPIDGFVRESRLDNVDESYREQLALAIRQRMGRHDDLSAVADALDGVPPSSPFDSLDELASIAAPSIVVGSRDAVDPSHPLAIAQRWAGVMPNARLEVEADGKSPLAWQGGRLARLAEELVPAGG